MSRRRRTLTPIPQTFENITAELKNAEEFVAGNRVYFEDLKRGNWYLGRIKEIHILCDGVTYDCRDEFGIVTKNLKPAQLRLTSEKHTIKFPPKRSLPKTRFRPKAYVQFYVQGKSLKGVVEEKKNNETFVVLVDDTTQNVHISQLQIAVQNKQTPKGTKGGEKKKNKKSKKKKNTKSGGADCIVIARCTGASSSDRRNVASNLDYGNENWWCTMWGKDSGWLNFDLGDDFVLRRIVVLAQNKRSAPRSCNLDYLNASQDLMYSEVVKFIYKNTGDEQEFDIVNDIPVRYVKFKIVNNWGEEYVGINKVSFYGIKADVFQPEAQEETPEESPAVAKRRRTQLMKWELGDRIDYQWDDSGKWYTGRILHINENCTYLMKDDHGFVKDNIPPEKVRPTKKRRKPRRYKASRKTTLETIQEYIPFLKPAKLTMIEPGNLSFRGTTNDLGRS